MPGNYPIMGPNQARLSQMVSFVKRVNPAFNDRIAALFLQIGDIYGIRGDMAFCQSIHETNWFRFTGDVRPGQNNFAGIGAVGGVPGNSFPSIETGITAQIQHLFAYATIDPIPAGQTLVDPRFALVRRGSAPFWEDLAGKWAVPGYNRNQYASLQEAMAAGATYGQQIISLYRNMLATPAPVVEQVGGSDGSGTSSPGTTSPGTSNPGTTSPGTVNSGTATPTGYPADVADWKKEAVEWMYQQGLLTSDEWKQHVDEPLPLWAEAVVLRRFFSKF